MVTNSDIQIYGAGSRGELVIFTWYCRGPGLRLASSFLKEKKKKEKKGV